MTLVGMHYRDEASWSFSGLFVLFVSLSVLIVVTQVSLLIMARCCRKSTRITVCVFQNTVVGTFCADLVDLKFWGREEPLLCHSLDCTLLPESYRYNQVTPWVMQVHLGLISSDCILEEVLLPHFKCVQELLTTFHSPPPIINSQLRGNFINTIFVISQSAIIPRQRYMRCLIHLNCNPRINSSARSRFASVTNIASRFLFLNVQASSRHAAHY